MNVEVEFKSEMFPSGREYWSAYLTDEGLKITAPYPLAKAFSGLDLRASWGDLLPYMLAGMLRLQGVTHESAASDTERGLLAILADQIVNPNLNEVDNEEG
jgi:hypothetical protein